jgi:hypothetical protein
VSRVVTRTVGDVTDPEFRRERARVGARAAHTIDAYVRRVVARADQLTPEHTAILLPLLPPVPAADGRGETS